MFDEIVYIIHSILVRLTNGKVNESAEQWPMDNEHTHEWHCKLGTNKDMSFQIVFNTEKKKKKKLLLLERTVFLFTIARHNLY